MKLSNRLARLGTETAFAVSAEAAVFAAEGNTVYPFHLGDINLPTPQNVVEAMDRAVADGKTGYCPNAGIPALREALAADINTSHGTSYTGVNVSVQPGGKPVIGKFLLAVMNPGDEVLYPNPGYPIYESMIEFHGGIAVPYGYRHGETNFELDFDALETAITPKTRILIYNNLQNPTGAESSAVEMERLAELVRRHDLAVLCDEAYFDMRYSGASRSFVELPEMADRCVILYTFSKKFAMTGWRLGAAIGPGPVVDAISKLNVNAESCTTHFIQVAGVEALTGDQSGSKAILAELRRRRDRAVELLNGIDGVSCYRPEATFYLYPEVTEVMKSRGFQDYESFRRGVLRATGVSFCTRLHFGRPVPGEERRYVRFAYSGIDVPAIEEGLERLRAFLTS
ncbi:MAG: pyridoxal phosphate-dependent aminotransferase [Spirochaetaceae bacterium]